MTANRGLSKLVPDLLHVPDASSAAIGRSGGVCRAIARLERSHRCMHCLEAARTCCVYSPRTSEATAAPTAPQAASRSLPPLVSRHMTQSFQMSHTSCMHCPEAPSDGFVTDVERGGGEGVAAQRMYNRVLDEPRFRSEIHGVSPFIIDDRIRYLDDRFRYFDDRFSAPGDRPAT